MPEDTETPDKISDSSENPDLDSETTNSEPISPITSAGVPNISIPSSSTDESSASPASHVSPDPEPKDTLPPQVVVGNHKRRSKLWLLLLVIILVAAAGAAYLVHNHKTTKAVTATVAAKQDIPLLNYGVVDQLSQTYPLGASSTATMSEVNAQLFEGLVRYQQLTKITPLLATSWYNPNDTTWVFNLRQGVKFHDGHPVTAQAVKDSLDYAVAHQNDSNGAAALANASTIKQVDVVNGHQIKITTDGPDPTLLNRLTQLFVFDKTATLGDPNAGTGPYTIKPDTTPSASSMDLAAANNYWGGHIYTRDIHIGTSTDGDKLADQTAAGKYDVSGDYTSAQLAKLKNFTVLNVPDFGVSFLGFNTLKSGSPLSSLTARQAASYALNTPAILKASGLSGTAANQLIPSVIPGYDPSIKSPNYDPAKAKQLLASVKNANAPLTLSYPSGDDAQVNEIAKELNAVGFNVTTSVQPDVGSLVDLAFAGKTDMFYLTYSSNDFDGLDIIQSVVTVSPTIYDNKTIDGLADQASSTLEPTKRIKLLQQISEQVAADVPDVPLYTVTRHFVVKDQYHVQVDIPSSDVGVYFWQAYQH